MARTTDGDVVPGHPHPLGATVHPDGVNFSVYARNARRIDLLLFDDVDATGPARTIALEAPRHRSYHYWHAFVPGVGPNQLYAFRAHGPWEPERGMRFEPAKVLLDPYGRAVARGRRFEREAARGREDNAATCLKSVVANVPNHDWEGDRPLRTPFSRTVLYEMHVGAFTRHPNSGVAPERRGTFAGLIEKIPYLTGLGVTAVELMPVFQFDPGDAPPGRTNVWGYSPISFFAPHAGYSSRPDPLGPIHEFRDMVKALHRAGIEVILDVVFNHTSEGNHDGPTYSLRGLENATYYILESDDRSRYANYTGCGNTLNSNHSVVRRMILDSLRYWVQEMHVDGFRFDLASILARDGQGRPLENPPAVWDIESDPVLAGTKLIAEAWDAAGLYQVGSFVGDAWKEWNGRFRDDVRSFVRGEPGTVSRLASRLLASPDVFGREQREPEQSVNFVTCHDGFTLNHLVSYDRKHNEANGEQNRDGSDDNRSWNCGVEGPTGDPAIEALRGRQARNFLALTLTAMGTPMILMGDEVRRTQRGNNNAYAIDDETSWFDWDLVARHRDLLRFTSGLIRFRLERSALGNHDGVTLEQFLRTARIRWHGVSVDRPDWSETSRSLAVSAEAAARDQRIYLAVNAYWEALDFELPAGVGGPVDWRRVVDTSLTAPDDFQPPDAAPAVGAATYRVGPRSVVLLASEGRGALLP
jgi:glycogen operon protein